ILLLPWKPRPVRGFSLTAPPPALCERRHCGLARRRSMGTAFFSHRLVIDHTYPTCWVTGELQGDTSALYKLLVFETPVPQMLSEEDRALLLSVRRRPRATPRESQGRGPGAAASRRVGPRAEEACRY